MAYAPTTIDLSRVPAPNAIEPLSAEVLIQQFIARFVARWALKRQENPNLPDYDVQLLETDPAIIAGEAFGDARLMDRARVNEAARAVLAPLARGADLDNIAASANVQRLVITPANPITGTAAVMESDAALLRRYLYAFDRPAAGSADRFLFEAWTAWPLMGDAAVVGRAVHGRRGDVDIVVSGPAGRDPTAPELALVRVAVTAPHTAPEAVAVSVFPAKRRPYSVALVIDVPPGPDAEIVAREAARRVRIVADERTTIGGEVPPDLLSGAGYGPSVIKVFDSSPIVIEPDPYTVPVCTAIKVIARVGGVVAAEVNL